MLMNKTLGIENLEKREMFCHSCAVDMWINHGMKNDFMDSNLPPIVEASRQANSSDVVIQITGFDGSPADLEEFAEAYGLKVLYQDNDKVFATTSAATDKEIIDALNNGTQLRSGNVRQLDAGGWDSAFAEFGVPASSATD